MNQPMWAPSADRINSSNISRYQQQLATKGLIFSDYAALHRWSVENREDFWQSLIDFCALRFDTAPHCILENGEQMPGARWFPGSTLNYAEQLLAHFTRHPQQTALIFCREDGKREALSGAGLIAQVAALSAWLRARGVGAGDRVAAYMPNCPQTVVMMLATTSIGAIFSSCSPDFGVNGVVDRFGQIEAKVLISVDGYVYANKRIDIRDRLIELQQRLPSVQHWLVHDFLEEHADLSGLAHCQHLADALTRHQGATPQYSAQPFDHPLYIMFSSGTTGVPKCIVHSAGGTLLQHLKEMVLHADVHPGDHLFYYTTCGWMMWNWLISGLSAGATLVLFDGSPFHPHSSILIDLIDQENIQLFGVSAKYIAALEKAGVKPRESHSLTSLRAIFSTGSPLLHESFDYIYRDVKADICLSSISGGTDIISCFALGNPSLPVWRGELQCLGLGMAVDVFDDDGRSQPPETKGELVCTRAFPCMPLGFWNDKKTDAHPYGEKFHDAYFSMFPHIWAHGDYASLSQHGGLTIHGRSDAVLNPGGVRIGTAEIYRQVEKVDAVLESLCIGQDWQGDVRVVLFVRLRDGVTLDDSLREQIRKTIRSHTTPRHVPAKILQVTDIPRTISGKITELAVRNVVHGLPVKNTEALANPESLSLYKELSELQS